MLFAIEHDPHEQRDIARSSKPIVANHAALLAGWHAEMMDSMPDGYAADPLWTVMREGGPAHARGKLRAYCERLHATGRGWAVEELWRRHARDSSVAGGPCPEPEADLALRRGPSEVLE
jgi:hypothetical protein